LKNKELIICLVIVDSLRADHLSCYGYNQQTSVNIDSISNNSVVFRNAISQSNWTLSSMYSLITSRYPSIHGITWFDQRVDNKFMTLPETLKSYGYQTAIFSRYKSLLNKNIFGSHFNEAIPIDIETNSSLAEIGTWIKHNKKCFCIFHIGDFVHEPYCADKKYVDMFYRDGYEGLEFNDTLNFITSKISIGVADKMRDINRKLNMRLRRLTDKQLSYLIACYDAGIYYVDKIVGQLYEIVQNENNDYMFIVTADHGQCFFEHGFYGHGLHLYDEVTRVPLIVDMNQQYKRIIDEPVQHIDIFPTILDILEISNPDFKTDGTPFTEAFASTDNKMNKRLAITEAPPFISIRNREHKLITTYNRLKENGGIYKELYSNLKHKKIRKALLNLYSTFSRDELFDIQKDTKEKMNIRSKEKDVYRLLYGQLKLMLENMQKDAVSPINVSVDDEIRQQLSNLGYM